MSPPPKKSPSGTSRSPGKGDELRWLRGGDRDGGGKPEGGSRRATPPRVVVCDDGELDDVVELLAGLERSALRVRPSQVEDLMEWERPTRLFIAPVRVALSSPLSVTRSSNGLVSIAIADNDAQTLCTAMLRRGFRYVVRRPVHLEALRLLLLQVLYAGPEHRLVARFPFGAQVHWRRGFRTGHCTMTEVSAHGCRLLASRGFSLHSRVTLRVPAALTNARDLRLRGRVLRRELVDHGDGPRTQVAIQFERLSARTRAHLDALLAEHASGPAAIGESHHEHGAQVAGRSARSRFDSLTLDPEPVEAGARTQDEEAPEVDRRRRMRGEWRREVVALDDETADVMHVLLGTDLSPGGLRVEPHPLLRIGDRMRLALYDAGQAEPLIVRARAGYDDGRKGWGLIFEDLSEETKRRLEEMVGSLPPVSALSDDDKPRGVVLGQIMAIGGRDSRS